MKNQPFIIKGNEIALGETKQLYLRIARLPTHTHIDLPVYIFRGKKAGPTLLLTAGMHGDETNGIEIVRRMIRSGNLMPDRGSIIAIPIVNIYGFLQHARYLPDGKDLNRSFPGHQSGSLARRVAWALMNDIMPWVDVGVDFHTGGSNVSNFPQIRCELKYASNKKLAQYFDAPFTLDSTMIEKSFRKAAHKIGKHIIVYEGGESLRFDEFAIQEAIDGTMRLMKGLNMIDSAPEKRDRSIQLKKSAWVRARYSGLFHSTVKPGDFIKRNQQIGTITDPYGETVYKVKSTEGGYVVGMNFTPVLNAGDAILHLGKE
jgi:predicted deacylase